jgi:N-methylhydantoinase A
MRLDVDAARGALERRLGGDALAAAARVRAAVDEAMALAFRRHCAERGYDPAARPIYAFGGAGPVHACAVAELLGADRVIVPPDAGVGSAVGLLAAPPRVDLARTSWVRLDQSPSFEAIDRLLAEMADEARGLLATGGVTADQVTIEQAADLRFLGQAHQLSVPLPPGSASLPGPERAQALIAAFEQDYARVYGRIPPGVGVQALVWRLTARGPAPAAASGTAASAPQGMSAPNPSEAAERPAWFSGEMRPTRVIRRERLAEGEPLEGPLLIEEDASTTAVAPGWRVSVLPTGHLDLRRTM